MELSERFCTVCEHFPTSFSALFTEDGAVFSLCVGCCADLIKVIETFNLNVLISFQDVKVSQ